MAQSDRIAGCVADLTQADAVGAEAGGHGTQQCYGDELPRTRSYVLRWTQRTNTGTCTYLQEADTQHPALTIG